jgi:nitrogen fixation NifU-like protein
VFLTIDASGTIQDAACEGQGCAISVASASIMTETLKGRTVDQARALYSDVHALCTEDGAVLSADMDEDTTDRLMVLSGVRQYPMRVKCATLAWHTMSQAIDGKAEEVST